MSNSWCTVESDPGVFTELIQQIGVSGVQVEELYDLDPSHLDRISPVFGLIFLFKYQASPLDKSTQTLITPENPLNDGIYFARQMITNACGTQAILNLLLNLDDATAQANNIRMGDEIRNFKEFTQFLPADMRGEAISNSDLIRKAHNGFARPEPFVFEEKKARSDEEADDAFHFIGYLPIHGKLYELDGLKPGPILIHTPDGVTIDSSNWMGFARTAIQTRLAQYASKEIRFNLMALIGNQAEQFKQKIAKIEAQIVAAGGVLAPAPAPAAAASASSSSSAAAPAAAADGAVPMEDTPAATAAAAAATAAATAAAVASAAADAESGELMLLREELSHLQKSLADEVSKMDRWRVENLRRKHNYVPFIFQLLRMLAEKGKLSGLVESAVKNSAERSARQRQAATKRKEAPVAAAASATTAATTQPTGSAATTGGAGAAAAASPSPPAPKKQ